MEIGTRHTALERRRFKRGRLQNLIYTGVYETEVSILVQANVYHKISTGLKMVYL